MKSSLPPLTKAQQARIEQMRSQGCCACRYAGYPNNTRELELHHLLEGNRRISHDHTMFLCRGHHQGQWSPEQLRRLDKRYRVAISSGRKAFAKAFTKERELWEHLQARLGLEALWPSTKILPRAQKSVHLTSVIPEEVKKDGV